MKKIIYLIAVGLLYAGCSGTKNTTASNGNEEKKEAPAKTTSPDRDTRGNYLK